MTRSVKMSATIDRIIATPTHIRYAGSNGFFGA